MSTGLPPLAPGSPQPRSPPPRPPRAGSRHEQARPPRVLVPGAGLGRLMVDVAALGMEAQGNEFSYFMLLAGSYILNHIACAGQWTVHPWMHGCLNHLSDEDQVGGTRGRGVGGGLGASGGWRRGRQGVATLTTSARP